MSRVRISSNWLPRRRRMSRNRTDLCAKSRQYSMKAVGARLLKSFRAGLLVRSSNSPCSLGNAGSLTAAMGCSVTAGFSFSRWNSTQLCQKYAGHLYRCRQRQSMTRDHELFIRWYDIAGNGAALRRDAWSVSGIRLRIDREAEPGQPRSDNGADRRRTLADPGSEDEPVDAAHHGGQLRHHARATQAEIVQSEPGPRILARQKLANVAAHARQTLQAALVIKELLNLLGRHVLVLEKIQNDARIQAPRPCPHGQAVEGGEPPACFDASAADERAHRAAVAEMGDDDPALGQCGVDFLQAPGNELVGDAMKAVAQHALAVQRLGYGQPLDEFVVAAMKAGIEYGDLRNIGQTLVDMLDRRQLARQMKRHERYDRT